MDRPVSLDDRAVPPIALGTCICANPSRSAPTVAWSPTCNWPRTSGTLRSAAPRPAFCVTSGVPTMPPLQSACADLPRAFCAAARPRESSPRTATGAWSAPGPTATSIRLKRCGSGWASARSSPSRRRRGGWASMSSARCSRWWPTGRWQGVRSCTATSSGCARTSGSPARKRCRCSTCTGRWISWRRTRRPSSGRSSFASLTC